MSISRRTEVAGLSEGLLDRMDELAEMGFLRWQNMSYSRALTHDGGVVGA